MSAEINYELAKWKKDARDGTHGLNIFRSAWAKFDRALIHRDDLVAAINRYQATKPFVRLPNGTFQADPAKPVPVEIALIVGDLVHNLRASLDHAMGDIVRAAGFSGEEKWVMFPYANKAVDLARLQIIKELRKTRPVIADLVELFGPVHDPLERRSRPLSELHTLDVIDKHRLLLPILSLVFMQSKVELVLDAGEFTRASTILISIDWFFAKTEGIIQRLEMAHKFGS